MYCCVLLRTTVSYSVLLRTTAYCIARVCATCTRARYHVVISTTTYCFAILCAIACDCVLRFTAVYSAVCCNELLYCCVLHHRVLPCTAATTMTAIAPPNFLITVGPRHPHMQVNKPIWRDSPHVGRLILLKVSLKQCLGTGIDKY